MPISLEVLTIVLGQNCHVVLLHKLFYFFSTPVHLFENEFVIMKTRKPSSKIVHFIPPGVGALTQGRANMVL